MKDDYLLVKKKGMTVSKAWVLFLSIFLFYLIGGMVAGIMMAMGNSSINNPYTLSVYISIFGLSVLGVIGYFINCKELPRFKSISVLNILFAVAMAVCFRVATSIVEELPFSLISQENLGQLMEAGYIIVSIQSIGLILFQVGIIGHGLLRNYDFTTAVLTTSLVSLINFEPKTIIVMILLISLLLYIYYKTASFQMVIIIATIYMLMDMIFTPFFDFNILSPNNWRTTFIGNDTAYFTILGLSVVSIFYMLRIISQLKPLEWRRTEELPDF